MIDLLARVLATNGLQPDSFTASTAGEHIFRGELQAGRVVETWLKLAKASADSHIESSKGKSVDSTPGAR